MNLTEQTRAVLEAAVEQCPPEEAAMLEAIARQLDEPLRLAIAGRVKAGKSTLLNALVGDGVAPTDAAECTKLVTWYADGVTYRAWMHPKDGSSPAQVPFIRDDQAAHIDIGSTPLDEIDHLTVEFPSQNLHGLNIIDTPGTASVSEHTSARTTEFLLEGDGTGNVDIVLYLMRHLHDTDVDFLESFAGGGDRVGRPTMAIGVLSRADEIGGGRSDAMEIAARIAGRYNREPRLRERVQTVIPIAGLMAFAAATLRQDEFELIQELARRPLEELDEAFSTVDAFTSSENLAGIDATARRSLLMRLGMHGIGHAVGLLHHGRITSAGELADALMDHSGLARLRLLVQSLFGERQAVLKAELALGVVEDVCRRSDGDKLRSVHGEIERIRANAQDIAELHALNRLRAEPPSALGEHRLAEAERILGNQGTSLADRLGLEVDFDRERARITAMTAIDTWRGTMHHPLSDRDLRDLASVVVVSLERLYGESFDA